VGDGDGSCGFSGRGSVQLFIDASGLEWVGLSIALRPHIADFVV
jgi:hypothetical protein